MFQDGCSTEKRSLLGQEGEQCREQLLVVAASAGNCFFFQIVSNKIRVGGEQGQNSRQSQEAAYLDKNSRFVISLNQRVSRRGEGGTELSVSRPF